MSPGLAWLQVTCTCKWTCTCMCMLLAICLMSHGRPQPLTTYMYATTRWQVYRTTILTTWYCTAIVNSRMWNGNGTTHMYTPHAQGDRCAAQYWTIMHMTLFSSVHVNSRVWNGNWTSIRSMEFKLCSVSWRIWLLLLYEVLFCH